MAALLRQILEGRVKGYRIDSDVSKREILGSGRLLNEVRTLAVPEHGVRARPPDADVLPEPSRKRRMYIVVESAGNPLLVRFARGIRNRRRTIQKHVSGGCGLTHHERMASFVGGAPLHQRELPGQPESES